MEKNRHYFKKFKEGVKDQDLDEEKDLVSGLASADPCCLRGPPPVVLVRELPTKGVRLSLQVWCYQKGFLVVGSCLQEKIKLLLDKEF